MWRSGSRTAPAGRRAGACDSVVWPTRGTGWRHRRSRPRRCWAWRSPPRRARRPGTGCPDLVALVGQLDPALGAGRRVDPAGFGPRRSPEPASGVHQDGVAPGGGECGVIEAVVGAVRFVARLCIAEPMQEHDEREGTVAGGGRARSASRGTPSKLGTRRSCLTLTPNA